MSILQNMVTIQKLNRDKERKDKKIHDLEVAARVVIDMLDPPQPGVINSRAVLECLRDVPAQIERYMSRSQVCCQTRTWTPHVVLPEAKY